MHFTQVKCMPICYRQHSIALKSEVLMPVLGIQKLPSPLTKLSVALGKLLTHSNLNVIIYKCDRANACGIGCGEN